MHGSKERVKSLEVKLSISLWSIFAYGCIKAFVPTQTDKKLVVPCCIPSLEASSNYYSHNTRQQFNLPSGHRCVQHLSIGHWVGGGAILLV